MVDRRKTPGGITVTARTWHGQNTATTPTAACALPRLQVHAARGPGATRGGTLPPVPLPKCPCDSAAARDSRLRRGAHSPAPAGLLPPECRHAQRTPARLGMVACMRHAACGMPRRAGPGRPGWPAGRPPARSLPPRRLGQLPRERWLSSRCACRALPGIRRAPPAAWHTAGCCAAG